MNTLRWLRGPGDVVFAIGILAVAYFVLGVIGGWSIEGKKPTSTSAGAPTSDPGHEAPAMARSSV